MQAAKEKEEAGAAAAAAAAAKAKAEAEAKAVEEQAASVARVADGLVPAPTNGRSAENGVAVISDDAAMQQALAFMAAQNTDTEKTSTPAPPVEAINPFAVAKTAPAEASNPFAVAGPAETDESNPFFSGSAPTAAFSTNPFGVAAATAAEADLSNPFASAMSTDTVAPLPNADQFGSEEPARDRLTTFDLDAAGEAALDALRNAAASTMDLDLSRAATQAKPQGENDPNRNSHA